MKYEFSDESANAATVNLYWEKLRIPFKVEVDITNTQLASIEKELRTNKGFRWENWNQAAQWTLQNNTNLEEGLLWADSATSPIFGGDRSFQTWSIKSQLLQKMGKQAEADAMMKKALPLASMLEIHQYGRQLLQQKKNKEALEVFKMNFDKNPNQFTTLMGLARGYSANGDYKNALKYAKMALPLAPNPQNKSVVENGIKKLEDGKDMN